LIYSQIPTLLWLSLACSSMQLEFSSHFPSKYFLEVHWDRSFPVSVSLFFRTSLFSVFQFPFSSVAFGLAIAVFRSWWSLLWTFFLKFFKGAFLFHILGLSWFFIRFPFCQFF
jgi:hypothetical protein